MTLNWALPAGAILAAGRFVMIIRGFRGIERNLYAGALIVAAAVYLAAALVIGSPVDIVTEAAGMVLFAGLALLGLWSGPVWLSMGWLLHAVWDTVRSVGANALLPLWYAQACLGFDLVIAAGIFWHFSRAPQPDQ